MPIKQSKKFDSSKASALRAKKYMGYNLKLNSKKVGFGPRWAMQRNLNYLVDHEAFSHLLSSINWWLSQRDKVTHTEHTTSKKDKLE